MIRNLKALSLALAVVFAMGAVVASAASAGINGKNNEGKEVDFAFTAPEQTGGAGANALTAFGSTIECSTVDYEGHKKDSTPATGTKELIKNGATEVTVTPHYSGCKDVGTNKPATVNMTGCDFTLTLGAATSGGFGVGASLVCKNAGEEAHVEVFNDAAHTERICTVTFAAQTPTSDVHAFNGTPNGDIGLKGTYTNIVAKREGLCLLLGGGTNSAVAQLHIDVRAEGTDGENNPVNLTVS
jgi:hypothetical protein